jgi:NAD+ synthase (glutamine-hydrolysing)
VHEIAENLNVPPERLCEPFVFGRGKNKLTVQVWLDGDKEAQSPKPNPNYLMLSFASQTYRRNGSRYMDTGTNPLFTQVIRRCGITVAHCCAAGVADMGKAVCLFEGGSSYALPDGTFVAAPRFKESVLDLPPASAPRSRPVAAADAPRTVIEAIETACAFHLKRLGLSRVVIGASGGIDSALAAAIYARVAGAENVLLANLPSRHNSRTTITLARQLAERLGTYYTEVPIEESVRHTCGQINGLACKRPTGRALTLSLSDLAVENVQARDRSGRVLAALASAFGGVFTCNANKSETTIGYGTMYGDLAGFFAVLADLWKTEVWELAACYNAEVFGAEVIPQGSIALTPSAELSPAQNVDEGKGDPLIYPWHDRLFAAWTERGVPATVEDIVAAYKGGTLEQETGFAGDIRAHFPTLAAFRRDTEKMWRLYTGLARAKRLQAPPVLSLKSRTFGFELR